jgi:hypothetical protein
MNEMAPNPAAPRGPRLLVVAIAPQFAEKRYTIPFSDEDARAIGPYLQAHLTPGLAGRGFEGVESLMIEGSAATTGEIEARMRELAGRTYDAEDLVAIWLETHVIDFGSNQGLVGSDVKGLPPENTASAEALAEALAGIAAKCRVVLFLDGVHVESNELVTTDINEWVRRLRNESSVTTIVASTEGPGRALESLRHRVFASAVLEAVRPGSIGSAGGPMTLREFAETIGTTVQSLSKRQQFSACFTPESIDDRILIFRPEGSGSGVTSGGR